MPSLSHLLLNFLELRPHAVASGFPFHLELSAAACSADEGEAQKIEGLRFSEPSMSAALHCEAAELDQTGPPHDSLVMMPVCTENSVGIDYVTESPNVSGDDRSVLPLPGFVRLAVQVEEPT